MKEHHYKLQTEWTGNEGSGKFVEVSLFPTITVKSAEMKEKALSLHQETNKICFIANSCNFPIKHFPVVEVN